MAQRSTTIMRKVSYCRVYAMLFGFVLSMFAFGALATGVQQNAAGVMLKELAQITIPNKHEPELFTALLLNSDKRWPMLATTLSGDIVLFNPELNQTQLLISLKTLRNSNFFYDGKSLGLYSIALHPNFNKEDEKGFGLFYTAHAEPYNSTVNANNIINSNITKIDHFDVVSEWQLLSVENRLVVSETSREIIRIARENSADTIVKIAFKQHAKTWDADFAQLYIAVSGHDESLPTDVEQASETNNTKNINGTILRISPHQYGLKPYKIPDDNPFLLNNIHLPEVWLYGLHDVRGFTWDSSGKEAMIISDSSAQGVQEINLGETGAHFGSGLMTGQNVLAGDDLIEANQIKRKLTLPAASYDTTFGKRIIAGEVYRGRNLHQLVGFYLFADEAVNALLYIPARQLKSGSNGKINQINLKNVDNLFSKHNQIPLMFSANKQGEIFLFNRLTGVIFTLDTSVKDITDSAVASNIEHNKESIPLIFVVIFSILSLIVILFVFRKKFFKKAGFRQVNQGFTHVVWLEEQQKLAFTKHKTNEPSLIVSAAEITELRLILNDDTLLTITNSDDFVLNMDVDATLRDLLHKEHMDKMVPGKTRLLALEFIRQHKQTIFVCLYFRQGSRRVTRQPYRICVELLFDWAWRMASYIKPNALGQRIKPTPNEIGRFHRAPLKPQPLNKMVEQATIDNTMATVKSAEQNTSISTAHLIEPSLAPSIVFELEKLVQLKDQGYISEQEFERAKSKLLSD